VSAAILNTREASELDTLKLFWDSERRRTKPMRFERRDFLKTTTTGLAFGLVKPGMAYMQNSAGAASGEFEGGTGSLRLEGRLKAGVLKLEAQDFIEDKDRALIIQASLDSHKLYNAMFSYDHDRTVFALLRDNDHSTTLVLGDTDDPKIGRLVVWNDVEVPDSFRVDKDKFMDTQNLKESILDGKGKTLDVLGKRKPPEFTLQELETVFGSNPALLEFMLPSNKLAATFCDLLSSLPGSLFILFWYGY
jgi:hypothetical protein